MNPTEDRAASLSALVRSREAFTSAAVTSVPSEKRRPVCKVMTHVSPLRTTLRAKDGTTSPASSTAWELVFLTDHLQRLAVGIALINQNISQAEGRVELVNIRTAKRKASDLRSSPMHLLKALVSREVRVDPACITRKYRLVRRHLQRQVAVPRTRCEENTRRMGQVGGHVVGNERIARIPRVRAAVSRVRLGFFAKKVPKEFDPLCRCQR
eukprot:scaffold5366_cov128-Isochrysis_galbana.AAC.4